jgi:hypothetical protein
VDDAPHLLHPDEQRLDQREDRRGDQRKPEREDEDVRAGVAASDEELRAVLQHVEEWLDEREGPENRQVEPAREEATRIEFCFEM